MLMCERCGTTYPSKYYFTTDGLCNQCYAKLSEEERQKIPSGAESLSTEEVSRRIIDGHQLTCPICGRDRFWKRQTLLNTAGMTFLGIEWANKQAVNFVCDRCGYILWFLRDDS